MREAARGLAAGHREGIVHRDVKPANIFLVGHEGRLEYVRVLDFGIAKAVGLDDDQLTLTTAGQLPHSPAYASPEQTSPDTPVTAASDVYQLGLIAYELLAGQRAYTEADRKRIHAGEAVPLTQTPQWAAIPAPLRGVIERALSLDPADRYPDAAAFADALAEAEEGTVPHPGAHDEPTMLAPSVGDVPAMHAAAAAADADDDGTGIHHPSVATMAPEPVHSEPVSLPPAPRVGRRMTPAVWGIPLVLLVLVLAVWTARNRGGARAGAPVAADTNSLAALHGTFLRLQGAASAGLDSTGDDTATAAAEPETGPVDTSQIQSPEAAIAATTQKAVLDLNAAWSVGDLDRMMEFYARRVDYYGVENASRSFVRDRVRDTVRRYERRVITIKRQATLMDGLETARVLVDKDWDFTSDDERWYGSMRAELTMRLVDDQWRIVSERAVQIFNDKRERL